MTVKSLLGNFAVFISGLIIAFSIQNSSRTSYYLDLTTEQIEANLKNHTFLHVVGHHRGGTTLLWRALKTHPEISTFELRNERHEQLFYWISNMYYEGIFLQNVLPTFELSHSWKFWFKKSFVSLFGHLFYNGTRYHNGIGSFALNGQNHYIENGLGDPIIASERLFAQWGSFWDLDSSVLLEKSPSNAILTRLLNQLWNSANPDGNNTKFIFATRHPLMYAFSIETFTGDLSVYESVEHWLALQETFISDTAHLPDDSYRIIKLENLARNPESVLTPIFRWLGLEFDFESDEWEKWEADLLPDPNQKHERQYQLLLQSDTEFADMHQKIIHDFQDRISAISDYDLNEFDI